MLNQSWPWTISVAQSQIVEDQTQRIKIQKGAPVFTEGKTCDMAFRVMSGRLRVFKKSAQGKEINLYYVDAGQVCALGLQSCLMWQPAIATAVAEEDSEIACLPAADFAKLLASEDKMATEVIQFLDKNLSNLSQAFQRMSVQ